MFGLEHWGVKPDLIQYAKAITSGYFPLGGIGVSDEIAQTMEARHGGIMDLQGGGFSQGPGTGTSDSIPAMLSDGEFVMTADAVRGAGGGNRREGARRMYNAMDRLEARV